MKRPKHAHMRKTPTTPEQTCALLTEWRDYLAYKHHVGATIDLDDVTAFDRMIDEMEHRVSLHGAREYERAKRELVSLFS